MEVSLAGLIGAILGTAAAAASYGTLLAFAERQWRTWRVAGAEDRATIVQELALMRRGLFAINLLSCAGLGYWLGDWIAG